MHWVRSKWWEPFFVCFSVCLNDVSSKVAGLLSWTPLLTHMSYLNRYWFVFAVEWLQKYIIDPFLWFSLKWTSQHGSKFESGKKIFIRKDKASSNQCIKSNLFKETNIRDPSRFFVRVWHTLSSKKCALFLLTLFIILIDPIKRFDNVRNGHNLNRLMTCWGH